MGNSDLKSLVTKLNEPTRRCLESAAGLCLSRTHYHVEIEHWLAKLLQEDDGDLVWLLRHFDIDQARAVAVVDGILDKMRTGNGRAPSLAQPTVDLLRSAWMVASVSFGANQIRSGHMLVALIRDPLHFGVGNPLIRLLDPISADAVEEGFNAVTSRSPEARQSLPVGWAGGTGDPAATGGAAGDSKTPNLDRYTLDLTEQARQGKIDPVLGRDTEIRQMMDILLRRRQNNPILTGEPGVGKTAVVEGFALKVVRGDVPDALKDIAIRALDLGQLEAGAGVKGEFENRLKSILNEVQASPKPIVLMIDEAHTLVGAGDAAGGGDAANLLKPALARGELRTIAATTWAEYKKYFEKDAALTRRFQVVKVEEPTAPVARTMLQGVAAKLEQHHRVRILDDAIEAAVTLSDRYISGRQLPDKAVSVLDTACARIAISQHSTPGPIEDQRAACEQLATRIERLEAEQTLGSDHAEILAELRQKRSEAEAARDHLEARFAEECQLVEQILGFKQQLRERANRADDAHPEAISTSSSDEAISSDATRPTAADAPSQPDDIAEQLHAAEAKLAEVQGEQPLVYVDVDPQTVAATISAWTGIPLGRMNTDQTQAVLHLQERLERSVVGQSHALDEIARHIRSSRAGLGDPNKPIGVFMLAGTSGVGKTETALSLADVLYGGPQHLTTINMSEFKEPHKVSLLMGSPPGYVGYGEGGVLTEAVRRKPYSVVLLDELEKAHEGVQDVFYQVFDKGMMKDGQGRDIDFKNTVIIMTTNAGTELIARACSGGEKPTLESLKSALHEELLKTFKPAFLGRITILPYFPLDTEVLRGIARLKLDKLIERTRENHQAELRFTDRLIQKLAVMCQSVDTGARKVDQVLEQHIIPELSAELLARRAEGLTVHAIQVDWEDEAGFVIDMNPREAPIAPLAVELPTSIGSPTGA